MVKKIAVLGFVSGMALFLYGRGLLAQARESTAARRDVAPR